MAEVASESALSSVGVPSAAGPVIPASDGMPLIVAEYESLRAEILKLIELQSQLVALTVIAFGTVLSVGFQANKAVIILVYPLLSLILGISWLNHAHAIYRCAGYIAQRIEPRLGGKIIGWENFVKTQQLPRAAIGYWGVRSIFMGSSALSIVAGSVIPKHGPSVWAFYYLAIGMTILTVLVFLFWRERPASSSIHETISSPAVLPPEQGTLPIGDRSVGEEEHASGPALP